MEKFITFAFEVIGCKQGVGRMKWFLKRVQTSDPHDLAKYNLKKLEAD